MPTAAPGTPPPFAVVTKDATRVAGPIVAWRKDDKLWLELAPSDFGRPFLLSPKLATGIGETPLIGGLMAYPASGVGGPQWVEFARVHNNVRLLARNSDAVAPPGTPEARAVAESYSPSLLGSTAVASQPHSERKSVLVEANGLFLSDLLGVGLLLQRTWRQGYALDARNSVILAVRGNAESLEIETQNHYYAGSIATPTPGAPPTVPQPSWPGYIPDTRSLFIGHHYSLAALPESPLAQRRADPRIGLMTQTVLDFGDDTARSARKRFVERWRLEKKDPAAALSEPVKPITVWIDRNVPLKYRDVVAEGILEWNKAFERIGFKDAIVVQQQPDDADWSTLDAGRASVRWMASAAIAFGAIGPKHVDPRSGEILDADIGFESASLRAQRNLRNQTLAGPAGFAAMLGGGEPNDHALCRHADHAAEQLGYALDLLDAQGALEADPEATERFVRDYVKDTIMHEVGHALGLRHNFRASRVYTEQQLADPEFTRAHGTAGSVMEYNAINLPRPGQRGGVPFQLTLGPYDYWAIEYAYKPIAPADEAAELQRIAARSSEPELAFGSDEDAAFGIDPETIQLDLGADPIAYAEKRLAIAQDLFRRQETRALPPDQNYAVLRRSLGYAIGDVGRAVGVLTRQIGGVRTLRDYPGSGRDPLQPAPAATQREALDLIGRHVLAIDGLSVSPALQRRLAPDFEDRLESPSLPTDYPVPQRLLDLQRAVLAQLMSDAVAARILDNLGKVDQPAQAFQLDELYARLNRDIWSELVAPGPIAPARRELQREHVNRLAAMLLRPAPTARADARSLQRLHAERLLEQIERTLKNGRGLDTATRAHLSDSADTLRQALQAKTTRMA
ncbi:MAG: zinc-dependent metalloprotease [Burkholderiales bacterium]|nr:zinc-dependent metalloprotease [Burkholderiales bacterium]